MPRKGATITQADVRRTIRAAKQEGAERVEIRPDGTMLVVMKDVPAADVAAPLVPKDIVL